jgi:pimeloyl-ACP methyl ester carboxylesterase
MASVLPPVFSLHNNLQFMGSMSESPPIKRCWWMAEMCRLAYNRDEKMVASILKSRGMTVSFIDRDGTSGFMAVNDTDAFLIFRGTDPFWPYALRDLLTDIWVFPMKVGNAKVHRGFYKSAQSITPLIARYLRMLGGRKLWVAGQSLGGAIATFVARDLPTETVFLFGTPRVATHGYFEDYPHPIKRWVNDKDIIPSLPFWGGLKMANPCYHITGEGFAETTLKAYRFNMWKFWKELPYMYSCHHAMAYSDGIARFLEK